MDVDDSALTLDMNVSMEKCEWNSAIHLRFRIQEMPISRWWFQFG